MTAENYKAIEAERKRVDRYWAQRLFSAKDTNERARVLAEERSRTRFEPIPKARRTDSKPQPGEEGERTSSGGVQA